MGIADTLLTVVVVGLGVYMLYNFLMSNTKKICPEGWKPFMTDIGLECYPPKGTMGKACTNTKADGTCRPGETLERDPRGYNEFNRCCKQIRLA